MIKMMKSRSRQRLTYYDFNRFFLHLFQVNTIDKRNEAHVNCRGRLGPNEYPRH